MLDKELREQLLEVEGELNDGNHERAVEILEQLTGDYPGTYHVSSLLGECYLGLGKPEKAIKPLKWALKKHIEILENGESDELESNEELEAELDPEDDESHEIASINRLKKHFDKDEAFDPTWIDHFLLGCAYSKLHNYKLAIRSLNKAQRMNPENSEVLRNIGWIRCLQKKRQTGRKFLRKAIQIDPKNALAYNDLGASYLFEKKLSEAEAWINKAVELDPYDDMISSTADKLEELKAFQTLFTKKPHPKKS